MAISMELHTSYIPKVSVCIKLAVNHEIDFVEIILPCAPRRVFGGDHSWAINLLYYMRRAAEEVEQVFDQFKRTFYSASPSSGIFLQFYGCIKLIDLCGVAI